MQQQREPSASESYFWPTVLAIVLHVLVFGMLFVSFAFTPELPPAKPIVQATLYQLKSKSQATTQTNQKIAGEAKKSAARQTEVEQMEQKKIEQEAVKAAEQRKRKRLKRPRKPRRPTRRRKRTKRKRLMKPRKPTTRRKPKRKRPKRNNWLI